MVYTVVTIILSIFLVMTIVTVLMMKKRLNSKSLEISEFQKNEQKYKILFENANDIIFTFGEKGILDDVNESFYKAINYTDAEVIEKFPTLFDLMSPNIINDFKVFFNEIIENKKKEKNELELISKTGESVYLYGMFMYSEHSTEKDLIQAVVHDVTHKKEEEEDIKTASQKLVILNMIGVFVLIYLRFSTNFAILHLQKHLLIIFQTVDNLIPLNASYCCPGRE